MSVLLELKEGLEAMLAKVKAALAEPTGAPVESAVPAVEPESAAAPSEEEPSAAPVASPAEETPPVAAEPAEPTAPAESMPASPDKSAD